MSQHSHPHIQREYLQAMGIDLWELRDAPPEPPVAEPNIPEPIAELAAEPATTDTPAEAVVTTEPASIETAPLPGDDAPAWLDEPPGWLDDVDDEKELDTAQAASPCADMDWPALQEAVQNCQRCELYKTRTQTVFGVGNQQADLLIIGEAPGADEDKQGEPFVGKAGQLLNEMLKAIQLDRKTVYIANILKCRPPDNRDPKPEEATLCRDYLNRQIELIQPKLILAVGRIAAQRLLEVDTSLAKLRGQAHRYAPTDTPLHITYHPAYLLRSPAEKAKAWKDLLFVKRSLTG